MAFGDNELSRRASDPYDKFAANPNLRDDFLALKLHAKKSDRLDGDRLSAAYNKYRDTMKTRNWLLKKAEEAMGREAWEEDFDDNDMLESVLRTHDQVFRNVELTDAEESAIVKELKTMGKWKV